MQEQYKGTYRWRPTTYDLFTLALRDEHNRGLLFATRSKYVAEGQRIFLDAARDEPLLYIHCRNFSRLNPPYEIKSMKSGEQIGTIQAMAEDLDQRWYRLYQNADGMATEFRYADSARSRFTATQDGMVLGSFSFEPHSWTGANEATVDFHSDSANFLLLFSAWLFVMSKQYEDFFIHYPAGQQ